MTFSTQIVAGSAKVQRQDQGEGEGPKRAMIESPMICVLARIA